MKIIDASVRDRRPLGAFENPSLVLRVDEEVMETRDSIALGGVNCDWIVTPHGPFFAVDYEVLDGGGTPNRAPADIGLFNASGLWDARLVPVEVHAPDYEYDLSMGLDRARRLLRKFTSIWRLIMDDVAGQHGKIAWRLQRHPLRCVWNEGYRTGHACNAPAAEEVYYSGTHLPYCPSHLAAHNRKVSHLRRSASVNS